MAPVRIAASWRRVGAAWRSVALLVKEHVRHQAPGRFRFRTPRRSRRLSRPLRRCVPRSDGSALRTGYQRTGLVLETVTQIRFRFRFGFGGPSIRRCSSLGIGRLLLFAAGRGGGGSLMPVWISSQT